MSRAVDVAPRRKPPVIRTDPGKPGGGFRDRKRDRNDGAVTDGTVHSAKVSSAKIDADDGDFGGIDPGYGDPGVIHGGDVDFGGASLGSNVPGSNVPSGSITATSAKVSVLRLPAASQGSSVPGPGQQVASSSPEHAGTGAEDPVDEKPRRSDPATVDPSPAKPGTVDPSPAKPGTVDPSPAKPGSAGSSAKVLVFPGVPRRRRRVNLWIAVVVVAALIAVVMAAVMFSPLLALKTITVEGNKLATTQAIQSALAPLIDKPLPQIDQRQVQKLLVPLQQVRSVSVQARPPSSLLVHIVEREPVALLKTDQQYIMVDPDGVQLGTTPDPAAVALPLIDGGTDVIGKETFKAMTAVLAALPQSVLSKLEHASAASPDAVELTLNDGKTIIWGNASEKELKAKVLEALLTAPAPSAAAGRPAPAPVQVYDVSTPRHPVTR
ncbi:FtsQ-type POTRA domain-containing protein [Paeniglutamicibacter antarcticus]|uniref:FtsQ-type POTRA domain-containing protein n=1 Tax=Arthrobacter terrae TaxID=2935737 RepID=A0A931CUX5_9MICC|nr:FtsQ-type POTRA domain-containing protein [Arthrobacter terrae]MBG0741421.1 FtsQ-type POTRA domain-containing protein [Arthrobacter terrae]